MKSPMSKKFFRPSLKISGYRRIQAIVLFFKISPLALKAEEKQIFEIRVRKIRVLRKWHSKFITKIRKKTISSVLLG